MSEPPENDFDYSALSPGIRETVRLLRSYGHDTTDSGDGSNHAAGMECALPYRHVFVRADIDVARGEVEAIARVMPGARVELSWSPGEPAVILVLPDGYPETTGVKE